jgi:hypothetical protein
MKIPYCAGAYSRHGKLLQDTGEETCNKHHMELSLVIKLKHSLKPQAVLPNLLLHFFGLF